MGEKGVGSRRKVRPGGSLRLLAGGSATLFAATVVVLMLAPTTLGAHAAVLQKLKAPYKKATVVLTNPATKSGCGSYTQPTAAFWNKTTGKGGFSDNATAAKCTSTTTNNSAYSQGMMVITLPIRSPKVTGTHTIYANWTTVIQGWANITTGTCTTISSIYGSWCYEGAKAFVYGTAYLRDKTTKVKTALTTKWPGNFTYVSNRTYCYASSCSYSQSKTLNGTVSGTFPWLWDWVGVTLKSTDHYVLSMTIFGGSIVTFTTYYATLSGDLGNAQLNSATLGNVENLNSVVVT